MSKLPLSPAYSIYWSDALNSIKHSLIVILAGAAGSLLSGIQSGQIMDIDSFYKAIWIAILTGILVFLNRFFQDNTKTNGEPEGISTSGTPVV